MEHLVTGAGGHVGSVLLRALTRDPRETLGTVRPGGPRPRSGKVVELDIRHAAAVDRLIADVEPRTIIHLAAVTSTGDAYRDPEAAREVNVAATRGLRLAAERVGARLILASSDLVFDGEGAPYDEAAEPRPISVYGRTKLEAEREVGTYDRGVIVRLPWLYGFSDADRPPAFFANLIARLRRGEQVRLFDDEVRSALWYEDAVAALMRVADADLTGLIHAGGPDRLSRLEIGRLAARGFGLSKALLVSASRKEAPGEPRPRDVSLSSARFLERFGERPGRALPDALVEMARSQPPRS